MSDIHVLTGNYEPGREAVAKQYVFHFPIAASAIVPAAASDPALVGFESAVPNISASELAGIRAGEIVEYMNTFTYHLWHTPSVVLAEMRERYANLEPKVEAHYVNKYSFYGAEFTK